MNGQANWSLATPFGLSVGGIWFAGHVQDVLDLGKGSILVASISGGVWRVDPAGVSIPLSDYWDNAETACFARSSDGRTIAVGCAANENRNGALWMADAANLNPWRSVEIPPDCRGIRGILVLGSRIVIAAEGGLWWSSTLNPSAVDWIVASNLPEGSCFSLAEGPDQTVVVTVQYQGIFFGEWMNNDFAMSASRISPQGIDPKRWGWCAIASCASDRHRLFGVGIDYDGNSNSYDRPQSILSSTDGGRTWERLSPLDTSNRQIVFDVFPWKDAYSQEGYALCLEVSPADPSIVVVGLSNGPLVSQDGGQHWFMYGDNAQYPGYRAEIHADIHRLRFSADGKALFIASDGGILRADVTPGSRYTDPGQSIYDIQ
jgi:hypothetical protein